MNLEKKYLKYKTKYLELYKSQVYAISVLKSEKVNGIIYFDENNLLETKIYGKITGLKPNSNHAIHIHEYGDLSDSCKSCCAHFNPFNKDHGGRLSENRHVGDLGNVETDLNGEAKFSFIDSLVKLRGPYSVIGRSFIIHEDPDDLGVGGHSDSKTTGHAGNRLVCGVIGLRSNRK
jgi:Cu-Zn family superoxide dismutase